MYDLGNLKMFLLLLFQCFVPLTYSAPADTCPETNGEYVDFLTDSKDCRIFYKCNWGTPVLYECPANLYFNPVLNVCDFPRNVDCGDTISETGDSQENTDNIDISTEEDKITQTTDTIGTTRKPNDSEFTNNTMEVGESGNCGNRVGECPIVDGQFVTFLSHPSECKQFFICSNGVAVLMNCPEGLHFNPKLSVCDYPQIAGCHSADGHPESVEVTNPEEEATDLPVTSKVTESEEVFTESHETQEATESTEASTEASSFEETTKLDEFEDNGNLSVKCPDVDEAYATLLPHKSDYNGFFMCSAGVAILMTCPEGLYFNPILNVCDYPQNAGCGVTVKDPVLEEVTFSANGIEINETIDGTNTTDISIQTTESIENTEEVEKILTGSNESTESTKSTIATEIADLPATQFDDLDGDAETSTQPNVLESTVEGTFNDLTMETDKMEEATGSAEKTVSKDPSGMKSTSNVLARTTHAYLGNTTKVADITIKSEETPSTEAWKFTLEVFRKPDDLEQTLEGIENTEIIQAATEDNINNGVGLASLLPHETDCDKFYARSKGVSILMYCMKGMHFNPSLKVCDSSNEAGCITSGGDDSEKVTDRIGMSTASDETVQREASKELNQSTEMIDQVQAIEAEGSQETFAESVDELSEEFGGVKSCKFAQCPAINGIYPVFIPISTNCSRYCKCDWGIAYEMNCPTRLYFNPKLNVCDWHQASGCSV